MRLEDLELMLNLVEQVRKVADSQSEIYYKASQTALKVGLGGYAAGFQQTESCMVLIDTALSRVTDMLEKGIYDEKETIDLHKLLIEKCEKAIQDKEKEFNGGTVNEEECE